MNRNRYKKWLFLFSSLSLFFKVTSSVTCDRLSYTGFFTSNENYTRIGCVEKPNFCFDLKGKSKTCNDQLKNKTIDFCSVHHENTNTSFEWSKAKNFVKESSKFALDQSIEIGRTFAPTKMKCELVLKLKHGGKNNEFSTRNQDLWSWFYNWRCLF